MLQVLRDDGSVSFWVLERVSGTLAGRTGTFVPQDSGELAADGHVVGSWLSCRARAPTSLTGLLGEGGFDARLGQHAEARLDYWFE